MSKSRLLMMTRKRLGWKACKKQLIFAEVAKVMGVPTPDGAEAGYQLLAQWCKVTPTPKKLKRSNQKQWVPVPGSVDVNGLDFLESYEWRRLRMQVLVKRGARCECCGATPKDGVQIHVDHVKPRRLFPALALDENNLQVLCGVCNHGKGNWDQTDWRIETPPPEPAPVPVAQPADPMRPRLVKRA